MKLYIMRHGEAVDAATDPSRPLTAQGQADITHIASWLAERNISIPYVEHSKRLRTAETAAIVAATINAEKVIESKMSLDTIDSVDDVLEAMQDWDEDRLLVAHMPFVSQLLGQLVVGDAGRQLVCFSPGTLVCLDVINGSDWVITSVVSPKLWQ